MTKVPFLVPPVQQGSRQSVWAFGASVPQSLCYRAAAQELTISGIYGAADEFPVLPAQRGSPSCGSAWRGGSKAEDEQQKCRVCLIV